MKARIPLLSALLLLSSLGSPFAQGTAFTYQGRLNDGANPAAGIYDFRFRIAADPAGNNLVAGPLLTNAVPVNNGLFTLNLDFAAGLFSGSNYWLQVDVKTNGAASYATLTPLQALTPTPYAIFARGASNVLGAVSAAQLSGTISSPQLAGAYSNALNFNNPANQFTGTFNGDGASVSNVNAATLNGLAASGFWKTAGNSGTTPNANFLGTTDNQPLELRINGQRALRLTPNSNGGPNLLGGSIANVIAPGVVGGVLVGGGSISYFGAPYTNSIASDFDFIGGGGRNSIGTNSPFSTIVGGTANQIGANNSDAFIGGGTQNQIGDSSGFSTISGGLVNQIGTNSSQSTIGGGNNIIGSNNSESTIGGGGGNRILDSSAASTIAGGSSNQIQTNSTFATIAGGLINQIQSFSDYSSIGGGNRNFILTNSQYSVIAGGNLNSVQAVPYSVIGGGAANTNAGYAANIGGGDFNQIQFAADHTVIAGGGNNSIVGSFTLPVYDAIGGGNWNTIQTNSSFSVIAGGRSNVITAGAASSTISGGTGNTVFLGVPNATISGGSNNVVGGNGATVIGGLGNSALSPGSVAMGVSSTTHGFAAIAMGGNTVANGNNSLAAGNGAQATNNGAFVWADQTLFGFSSTNDNSFNVHAAGGVRLVTSGAGMSLDGPLNVSGLGFLQPFELNANGLPALRLQPMPNDLDDSNIVNVIAGSPANWTPDFIYGATIAGGGAAYYYGPGGSNVVTSDFGTVGGGVANTSGNGSTVAGGGANTAAGAFDAIGGGSGNVAVGFYSVVAGGYSNTNGAHYASIGGGFENTNNGAYATIPGGSQNVAGGNYSFASGQRAKANHDGTFVWADSQNADFVSTKTNQFLIRAAGGVGIGKNFPATALDVNGVVTATSFSGSGAALTGVAPASGSANYIQNQTALNQTAGFRITGNGIFNGGNVAIGTTSASTALHVRDTGDTEISIQSNDVGSHRWTLQSSGLNGSTTLDASFQIVDRTANSSRLLIGTNGFVGIGTSSPTNRLHVNGGVSATVFVPTSDRNAKENFAPVSAREVLDKVAALPISTWNYKEYRDGRHMGPMAQDFYAAFHLGGSERTITTIDPDGVALAAIQGLNQKLESASQTSAEKIRELQAENADLKHRLETENADLKRRLQALETVLLSQKSN